jgi:hypothetical protein
MQPWARLNPKYFTMVDLVSKLHLIIAHDIIMQVDQVSPKKVWNQ